MYSGPLAPMLSHPVVAAVFGVFCLLVLVSSLLTGATVMFPSLGLGENIVHVRQWRGGFHLQRYYRFHGEGTDAKHDVHLDWVLACGLVPGLESP